MIPFTKQTIPGFGRTGFGRDEIYPDDMPYVTTSPYYLPRPIDSGSFSGFNSNGDSGPTNKKGTGRLMFLGLSTTNNDRDYELVYHLQSHLSGAG